MVELFKLNQGREVFQRVLHQKLLSHLALVLAGIYLETVFQMELQHESEKAVASLIVIHLQDAIAPHLLSVHLTGLIIRMGEIFRGIMIGKSSSKVKMSERCKPVNLKYIVILLGTQAIEAILVALHQDSTDSHQEAEVHPGFPLEFLSMVSLF